MKVIILAGGFGTRLGEMTDKIPKPMVPIGNKPILIHIMELFASYGHTDFLIATGYKEEIIRNYFIQNPTGWNIKTINTGTETLTGGRVKKISKYIVKAASQGLAVILITHNVHHAYPVGNSFTVLNRGKSLGTFNKKDISREELLGMMAGGEELDKLEVELEEMNRINN